MRHVLVWIALSGIAFSSGCSMCCAVYDYAYPTYGGRAERLDQYSGRAGSAFYDASAGVGVISPRTDHADTREEIPPPKDGTEPVLPTPRPDQPEPENPLDTTELPRRPSRPSTWR